MSRQDRFATYDDFPARLRQMRALSGRTQTDFAAWGGVTLNSQSRYEAGKNEPAAAYFLRLAEHGVDVGYLFTGRRSPDSLNDLAAEALDLFLQLGEPFQNAIVAHLRGLRDATAATSSRQTSATLHAPEQDFRGKD